MKRNLLALCFLVFVGCASTPPEGRVVTVVGNDVFHVEYPRGLKVGDKVKIMSQELMPPVDEYATTITTKRNFIGEGRVSSLIHGNFYEIKTETAKHVPIGAIVEKY